MTELLMLSESDKFILCIKGILFEFYSRLERLPVELAYSYDHYDIFVWATINDDDESMENELTKASAIVNSRYYKYGYHIDLTTLEKSDNIPIPPDYKSIISKK